MAKKLYRLYTVTDEVAERNKRFNEMIREENVVCFLENLSLRDVIRIRRKARREDYERISKFSILAVEKYK